MAAADQESDSRVSYGGTISRASIDAFSEDASSELEALSDFFEHAAIGLHWVNAQGQIVRVNNAELALLGYKLDEYLGHHIREFHEDQNVLADILDRLARGETLHNYEAKMRAKDGSTKHVLIDSSVRFVDGAFAHTRCLTREITQQRRTEQALNESEALYRSLAGALPALIVTTTPSGEIEDIDENYGEYTGLTLLEAKDWSKHQVIHTDDFDNAMSVWASALASGQPMQNEMRLRRRDGVYRWYLVQGRPVRGPDGRVLRWVTVNVDIDDRKRTEAHEQYLAETTAKLVSPLGSTDMLSEIARLAVPVLADACAIGLFDGTSQTARVETAVADETQRASVSAIHLRGWRATPTSADTIGDAITKGRDVFIPHFSTSWIQQCAPDEGQRALALGVDAKSVLCVPLIARGETIGMATFATTRSGCFYTERDRKLLNEVSARLSIALENLRLYDELRLKAEELQRANEAKDEFLGLVSHELRTPLTTIRGNAEVLARRFQQIDAESREQALRDIAEESERLERRIDNLLLLARVEQGYELEREPVLVVRVVGRLVARHQVRNPTRRFEILDVDEPRPVSFPSVSLDQVLENLVSNAEKYSPRDETITIAIERTADEVRIRVRDRGVGVRPEDADRLFEPFYRSDATSGKVSGLGIGLSVCKRLVEAQGGRIWAAAREGGGSEFGVSLPVIQEDDEHHGT